METLIPALYSKILIVLGLLALSAFFSGSETALFSLTRFQISRLKRYGRKGIRVSSFINYPSRILVGIIVGNVLVNTGLSAVMTQWTTHYYGQIYVGFSIVLTTIFVLIFGEVIPKTLAVHRSEQMALAVSLPMKLYLSVASPVLYLVNTLTERCVKWIQGYLPGASVTEQELMTLMLQPEGGILQDQERNLLKRVLSFDKVCAEHIMTPRTSIVSISIDDSREAVIKKIQTIRHARYPVMDDESNNVIGFIQTKDFLLDSSLSVHAAMRSVMYVPLTRKVDDLFHQMQKQRSPIAVVVDEYGDLKGILTLTDIMEELVGTIPDEQDPDGLDIHKIDEQQFVVGGDVRLKELEEYLGVELEIPEDITLNGLIQRILATIPPVGQTLQHGPMHIQVKKVNPRQVLSALVKINFGEEAS